MELIWIEEWVGDASGSILTVSYMIVVLINCNGSSPCAYKGSGNR